MNNSENKNNGIKSVISSFSVTESCDRLEKIITEKNMNIIARINHAAGAEKIGEKLPATELIIFGNPQAGTPLMQNSQTVALDLPQKILVSEDQAGNVSLSYNDPSYLVQRHDITGCDELITKISNALDAITKAAAE